MENPIRIGFVGIGMMGQMAHLRNYVQLPECRVVAVSDLRPKLAQEVATRYGVPKVYPNAAEMLAHEELDALVAAQPFVQHGGIIPPLYKSRLPVFTEKPLASSVPVAEQLVAAARAAGTWHMVGYHKRSDPAVMWVKAEMERLKQTGELGKLRYVRLLMPAGEWTGNGLNGMLTSDEAHPVLPADPPEPGMDEATFNKYISFVNYYIHQVNLLRYLLDEPYHVTYADPSGVLLAAQSESGICGTIEMSPFQTTVDWQESALVAFEKGYFKIELPAPLAIHRPGRVEAYYDSGAGAEPSTVIPQLPYVHAMRQQAINFLRAVRGEIAPMCEAAEAVEDLKVARDYIQLWQARKSS